MVNLWGWFEMSQFSSEYVRTRRDITRSLLRLCWDLIDKL